MTRKTTIRLLIIVPVLMLVGWAAWFGVNRLIASRLPLFELVEIGDTESVAYAVRWQPSRLNEANSSGTTVVEMAARYGRVDIIRVLRNAGADVVAEDSKGETLLHRMAAEGQRMAVRTLVEAGADINAKANDHTKVVMQKSERQLSLHDIRFILQECGVPFFNNRLFPTPKNVVSYDPSSMKLVIRTCDFEERDIRRVLRIIHKDGRDTTD